MLYYRVLSAYVKGLRVSLVAIHVGTEGQNPSMWWHNFTEHLTSFESDIASPSRSDIPDASYPRRQGFSRNESLTFSSLGMSKSVLILWSSPSCVSMGIPWPVLWKNPYCVHASLTSAMTRSLSPGALGLIYPLRSTRGSVTSSVAILSLSASGSDCAFGVFVIFEDEGYASLRL